MWSAAFNVNSFLCTQRTAEEEDGLQARQLMAWGAEGVIVGSALVKALAAGATPAEGVRAVGELARKIRAAT